MAERALFSVVLSKFNFRWIGVVCINYTHEHFHVLAEMGEGELNCSIPCGMYVYRSCTIIRMVELSNVLHIF